MKRDRKINHGAALNLPQIAAAAGITVSLLLCSCSLNPCESGHEWSDATCIDPAVCKTCDEIGSLGDHTWSAATCTDPAICEVCGESGLLGDHLLPEWSVVRTESILEPELRERQCSICGERFEQEHRTSSDTLPIGYLDGTWLPERIITYDKRVAIAQADSTDFRKGETRITPPAMDVPEQTTFSGSLTIRDGSASFAGGTRSITSIRALESTYDLEPLKDYSNGNRVIDSPELTERNGYKGYTGDAGFPCDYYVLSLAEPFDSTYGSSEGALVENTWFVQAGDNGVARMCWYRVYSLNSKVDTPGGLPWFVEDVRVVKCYWKLANES